MTTLLHGHQTQDESIPLTKLENYLSIATTANIAELVSEVIQSGATSGIPDFDGINIGTSGSNFNSDIDMHNHLIHNLGNAVSGTDAINYDQAIELVDIAVSGMNVYVAAGITEADPIVIAHNGANPSVSVSAAKVILYDNPTFDGKARLYEVSGGTFPLVDNSTNYLYAFFDTNTQTAKYDVTTDVSIYTESDVVPVNTMMVTNGYIHLSHWDRLADGLPNKLHRRFVKTQRYAKETGCELSVTSGVAKINAGIIWRGARAFDLEEVFSNGMNDSFWYLFSHNATGGWIETSPASAYNYTSYDTPTGLQPLSNNFFNINWVFRGVEDHNHGYYVVSPIQYKDLPTAIADNKIPPLPIEISSHAAIVGRIICKKDISTPQLVESFADNLFSGTVISDHNQLSGLQGGSIAASGEYYHLDLPNYNNLTGLNPSFNGIQFDTTPTVSASHQQGLMQWDEDSSTIEIGMAVSGVKLQIGQEQLVKVFASTPIPENGGKVVYISGAAGAKPLVSLASAADANSSSKVIGITTCPILGSGTNQFGYVTTQGLVHDLNTASLSAGTILWLDTVAGNFTGTQPSSPNHSVYLGVVVYQHATQGIIYVNPINGLYLEELDNVLITNPVSAEVLTYSAVSGLWINKEKGDQPFHGFVSKANTTLTFSASAVSGDPVRTFAINPIGTYSVFHNGIRTNISTRKTIQIANIKGQHFVWMNANGTLSDSMTPWSLIDTTLIPVATLYWDGTNGVIGEERHGYGRNLLWHHFQHYNHGTSYTSGFTSSPTFNNNNTFTFVGGTISDEDIENNTITLDSLYSASGHNTCRIGYVEVSGSTRTMKFDPVSGTFIKTNVNGAPVFDDLSGTLQTIGTAKYGNYWIYATNRHQNPILSIIGQAPSGSNGYNSIADAQAAPQPTLYGLSVAEWKLLYRIVVQGGINSFTVDNVELFYNKSTGPAILATTPSSIAAANVSYSDTTALGATNVQGAIETLDNLKLDNTVTVNGKLISSNPILNSSDVSAVPITSTINNYLVADNPVLNSSDVSAVPVTATINNYLVANNPVLNSFDVSAVSNTVTINGKSVTGSPILTSSDVSALSNTVTINGKSVSGNPILNSSDVSAVSNTVTINGKSVTGSPTLNASDVSAMPISGGTFTNDVIFTKNANFITSTTITASSISATIDWNISNNMTLFLNSSVSSLTFIDPSPSGTYKLTLKIMNNGNYGLIWPSGSKYKWSGSTAISSGAGKIDFVSFYFDGNYHGILSLNFA